MIISYTLCNYYKDHSNVMHRRLMGIDNGFNCHTQEPLGLYEYVYLSNSSITNVNIINVKVGLFEL